MRTKGTLGGRIVHLLLIVSEQFGRQRLIRLLHGLLLGSPARGSRVVGEILSGQVAVWMIRAAWVGLIRVPVCRREHFVDLWGQ